MQSIPHVAPSSAALAATTFAPNLLLGNQKPSGTLNVAAIGCNGKGASDISEIAGGNRIAFLCDVDSKFAANTVAKYPDAKFFQDYREMFAQVADQIDVVTVSTPEAAPLIKRAYRKGWEPKIDA